MSDGIAFDMKIAFKKRFGKDALRRQKAFGDRNFTNNDEMMEEIIERVMNSCIEDLQMERMHPIKINPFTIACTHLNQLSRNFESERLQFVGNFLGNIKLGETLFEDVENSKRASLGKESLNGILFLTDVKNEIWKIFKHHGGIDLGFENTSGATFNGCKNRNSSFFVAKHWVSFALNNGCSPLINQCASFHDLYTVTMMFTIALHTITTFTLTTHSFDDIFYLVKLLKGEQEVRLAPNMPRLNCSKIIVIVSLGFSTYAVDIILHNIAKLLNTKNYPTKFYVLDQEITPEAAQDLLSSKERRTQVLDAAVKTAKRTSINELKFAPLSSWSFALTHIDRVDYTPNEHEQTYQMLMPLPQSPGVGLQIIRHYGAAQPLMDFGRVIVKEIVPNLPVQP